MVHIGQKIQERIISLGMSRTVFAERISKTRNVVYDIFKRKSIDTAQLMLISKVLDFDFFQYYSYELDDVKSPYPETVIKDGDMIYDTKKLKSENEHLKETNELLRKLNQALEDKLEK